jgi:hypothetical protein
MKRILVALCLLAYATGCGNSTTNSNSGNSSSNNSSNGAASLANSSGTYWQSSVIAGNGYYLELFLNSDGSGQCSYIANSQSYGAYNISWQLSNGNLALANGSDCLAPLISGVQETGNPVLAFTGTLNDGSYQSQLTFSLQSGTIAGGSTPPPSNGNGTLIVRQDCDSNVTPPGTVTSSPAGISCGSTCSGSFSVGTVVTLTDNAPQSDLAQFTGGCSGDYSCSVTIGPGNNSVTVNYDYAPCGP